MRARLGFIVSVFMVGALQAQAQNPSVCDRTPQVRDAIVAWVERYDGISDCTKIGAVQLSGVGEVYNDIGPPSYYPLRLDGTGITELKQGDFEGLLSLKDLHLQNNNLTTLPDSIFVGIPSLSRLYLNNNRLRKLSRHTFSGASAWISTLDLSNNLLISLPNNVFLNQTYLGGLNLHGNKFETLSERMFSGLGKLKSIDVGGNPFMTLPDNVFRRLKELRTLHMKHGHFTTLPAHTFEHLKKLQTLSMEYGALVMLPDSIFKNLIELQKMRLHENALKILSPDVFAGLKNLRELQLENNLLATLPSGVFSDLDSLEILDLRNNQFAMLPTGMFEGVEGLQGRNLVRLAGNPGYPFTVPVEIVRKDGDLNAPSPAEVVVRIDPGMPFPYQTTLEIMGGEAFPEEITMGPGTLESVPITITRYPGYSGAVYVTPTQAPDTPFAMRELGYALRFVTNSLLLFPESIVPNPAVCDRTPDVQDAIIKRLTNISECSEVTGEDLLFMEGNIRLSDMRIEELKGGDFSGLGNLDGLYLESNRITTLPDSVFMGLYGLSELYLHNNQLVTIAPKAFLGVNNLEVLTLYHNDIATLPKGVFSGLTNLTDLWLYNNRLWTLPDSMFADLRSLKTLSLSRNPGTPFRLFLEVIRTDSDSGSSGSAEVAIRVPEEMPLWGKPGLSLSAEGGTVSPKMVTLEAGALVSTPATVTRSANNTGTVTVNITQVDVGPTVYGVAFITPPLILFADGVLDTETTGELPEEVSLSSNYPNPFNPGTTIHYALPATVTLRLAVYDVLGREVAVLADGVQAAGRHTARFDAGHLPSGTYIVRLDTDERSIVRTMTLSR